MTGGQGWIKINRLRPFLLLLLLAAFIQASCGGTAFTGRYAKKSPREMLHLPSPGTVRYYTASWYGGKFHGRRTASGEIYDKYGLTAAHKSLPFGTLLKVTNPGTGSSVLVTVNDRGPFIRGRDLDLSLGAARRIGMEDDGVARVRVEFRGRNMRYAKYINDTASSQPTGSKRGGNRDGGPDAGMFTIQFGAFLNYDNAFNLKRALELNNSGVTITDITVDGKQFYRVRLGTFSSRPLAFDQAEAYARIGYAVRVFPK